MIARLLGIGLVAFLLVAAPAVATPREGLILHPPKVTLPAGWQDIPVHLVACPAYADEVACVVIVESWTDTVDGQRLNFRRDSTIYVPATWTGLTGREVLLHEYGHVFDAANMDDTERLRFAQFNHLPPDGWWEPLDEGDYPASPSELFADAYAVCGLTSLERRRVGYVFDGVGVGPARLSGTVYGWSPTRRQLRATCRLIGGAV